MNNKAQLDVTTDKLNTAKFNSLVELFASACIRFAGHDAYTCLGHTINFAQAYEKAGQLTSYLQNHTDLCVGDRVAIMMPNLMQYPIAVNAVLQAGMVVVNTNPLYTRREIIHQFNDADVAAVIVLANIASEVEAVLPETKVKTVIVTELVDFHPPFKRILINAAAKYINKIVPAYKLPGHVRLLDAIKLGRHKDPIVYSPAPDDLAMLQYTGGTTGVAKAAMLLHSNLVANALQCCNTFESYHIGEATDSLVLPLPLYHIYAFTMSIVMANTGNHVLLVPNPRDLSSVVKAMTHYPSTMFAGLNTLFVALSNDEAFKRLDFCRFKATTSGGMALTKAAAITWR